MSVAEDAWGGKKEDIAKTISRLENYPTDMSCWGNADQCFASNCIKEKFIKILKEELL